jgi:phosphatidylserine decarboxylase
MQLLNYIHQLLDYALELVKLVQNREVGWQTLNRKTGRYEREQEPIAKKLKLLLLFNSLTDWIDRTHLFRLWIHEKTVMAGKTADSLSHTWISPFTTAQVKKRQPLFP